MSLGQSNGRIAALLLALSCLWALGCQPHSAAVVLHPEVGFAVRSQEHEHYRKHGAEMGAVSEEQYLQLAQTLRDEPAGGPIKEARRADGVICRFDESSGEFEAYNPDLTIRTFFRPNDGEKYFYRQLKEAH